MAFKLFTIFLVLFLIQAAFGKSIDSSKSAESVEEKESIKPKHLLFIYAAGSFLQLIQQFSDKAADSSRQLLKDDSLLANDQPEVLEFKQNLTMFVEKYDANKETEEVFDIMELYGQTVDHYFDLDDDELTPESTFILDVLNKYKHKEIQAEFIKEFDEFVEKFKQIFEKSKSQLGEPELEWYEKFQTLTDFVKRIEALGNFIALA
ncbi:uncharacterized protein LOC135952495 [Calliphora vicina]|uniref:uncharacterized protein LOC135952495 n=1 Tax=Calliphora vicina TaxID=7373 RepID=UPI00325A5B61